MFEKGLQQQLSDCSKFSSGDVVSFKNPTTALNIQGMISTTSKKNSYIIFNDFPHIFQHKFFLDNIPAECSESDLLTYFSRFGTVVAVEIFKERLYVPEVSEKARIPKVIAKDASSETSNNSDEAATLTTAVAPDSQQEASDVSLENADSSICTSTGEEQEVLNETDPIPNASSPTEITLEESSKKDCSGARVEDMSDAQIKNKKKFAPVAKKRKTSAKRRNRSRLMQTPKQIPTSGIYAAIYFKDRACLSDLLSEDVRLLGFSLMVFVLLHQIRYFYSFTEIVWIEGLRHVKSALEECCFSTLHCYQAFFHLVYWQPSFQYPWIFRGGPSLRSLE